MAIETWSRDEIKRKLTASENPSIVYLHFFAPDSVMAHAVKSEKSKTVAILSR